MNHKTIESGIRRILITFDAAAQTSQALENAAILAKVFDAEVCGVFVEDIDLLRSAALPCVRLVSLPGGTDRLFESLEVERELRNLATQAENILRYLAQREKFRWSFRVVRGHVAQEIVNASQEADLVITQRMGRPLTRHIRLCAPARAAYQKVKGSVLFLPSDVWKNKSVMVVFDGSALSPHTLRIAGKLAMAFGKELVVLLSADSLANYNLLQRQAEELLADFPLILLWHYLTRSGPIGFCQHARELQTGLVVLAADNSFLQGDHAEQLLDELDCPVLVVR